MKKMHSAKLKHNSLTQLLAVATIATSAVTSISIESARAITFNGELDFGNATSPFASMVNPAPGDNFNVMFNPGGTASIISAFGNFSPTFTAGTTIPSNSPSVGFSYVSGSTYKLDQDLIFNFTSLTPTSFTLKQNSTFTQTDILNNGIKVGAGLQLANNLGSFFTNGGDITNIPTLAFSLNDTGIPSGGLFIAQAGPTTAVPEPFTIIGTIVGGTAAFRMRKKLSATNKNQNDRNS